MADPSKTEKPTPKRRRDERKKGNVFQSKDATSVATLIASFAMFSVMISSLADLVGSFMAFCFTEGTAPRADLDALLHDFIYQGILVVVQGVGPILLATALASIAVTFFQTRFLVVTELIKPKLSKLNPINGFKRLFSLRSLIEALKGILKITVLLVIVYLSVRDMFLESAKYLYTDIPTAAAHLLDVAMGMVVRIAIAFIALAAADFFYQRWEYERNLRMSKEEIKEEYKQQEGDPKVKSKIREIQRQRSQMRMMQKVPQADVVIRNPTHFAVALRYKPDIDPAPIVLAKGQDAVALRIIKKAEEHQVAVIENRPLARALYEQTELDQQIPPQLYTAVAEVLVYLFRLDEKKRIVKE